MNIALLVNYFPPEIGSAADLFYQLALEFQKKGHSVSVFTTEARRYNVASNSAIMKSGFRVSLRQKGILRTVEEMQPGMTVHRAKLLPLIYPKSGESSFFKKLEHILQPMVFFAMINQIVSADVMLIYSPPLVLGFLGSILGKILRIPTVVNVQDIHPSAVIDLGLLKNPLAITFLEYLERRMYKYAGAITVHSHGNKQIVINHGADSPKVFVIFNLCRIPSNDLLSEGRHFKEKHSIEDKFVVAYAGIMSFSQDLDTVIKAAKLLSNRLENVGFVLAGNGTQRRELELLSEKLEVPNIIFLPFQEGDDYWRLLSGSDVCLVCLKSSKVRTPVVPKKLEDIMAAGKPVIANVPLGGDVKVFIEKAKCGLVVEAESPYDLADAIQKVNDLPEEARLRYGRNGRTYAVKNFSPQTIVLQYEALFASLSKP